MLQTGCSCTYIRSETQVQLEEVGGPRHYARAIFSRRHDALFIGKNVICLASWLESQAKRNWNAGEAQYCRIPGLVSGIWGGMHFST